MLSQMSVRGIRPAHLTNIKAVYDRGCLTALPPKTLAKKYMNWQKENLPIRSKILLIVPEHGNLNTTEPPFSTSLQDLNDNLSSHFTIELLERELITEIKPHWAARGVFNLYECAYLLEKYK